MFDFSPTVMAVDGAIKMSDLRQKLPKAMFETCFIGEGTFTYVTYVHKCKCRVLKSGFILIAFYFSSVTTNKLSQD